MSRYILNGTDITGLAIPAGGTAGQMLVQQSATDGDVAWESPSDVRDNLSVLENDDIAYAEAGNVATKSGGYKKGELLVVGNNLKRAKADISPNASFTASNIEDARVSEELSSLSQSLTDVPFRATALGNNDDVDTVFRGVYNTTALTANIPTAHPYLVFCYGYNSMFTQIACRVSDGLMFTRSRSAGVWHDWQQLYREAQVFTKYVDGLTFTQGTAIDLGTLGTLTGNKYTQYTQVCALSRIVAGGQTNIDHGSLYLNNSHQVQYVLSTTQVNGYVYFGIMFK